MRFDIEAFRVLDVVIQEGSFGKAAAKLHKAQSAVSYQVKKLEEQLNVEIFDRTNYRAELTPAGKALWDEGRRMLQLAKRIENLAERYGEGWEPNLELVIDASLPMEPIMRALKVLTDKQVPTKIQVKTEALGGVQMRFMEDKADMMLVKEYQASPYLKALPLPQVTVVLVVSKEHPLAAQKQVTYEQLLGHVELTIHDSGDKSKQKLDELQFGGDRVFYMHSFLSKKTALLMGMGFGWMPLYLIQQEMASGELVELDLIAGSRFSFTPQLVYPSDRPQGKASKMITELILHEFNDYDQRSKDTFPSS